MVSAVRDSGGYATMARMPTPTQLEFGYNPPTGDRGFETIRPATFVADLHHALDVATQGLPSVWISDHLMFAEKYRLECWSQLLWIAARYPDVLLGTIVLANSFRPPRSSPRWRQRCRR